MTQEILTPHICSVSEFKFDPVGKTANGYGEAVAVLKRNQIAFYAVPPELYKELLRGKQDTYVAPEETRESRDLQSILRDVIYEYIGLTSSSKSFVVGDVVQDFLHRTVCNVQPFLARAILMEKYFFDLSGMGYSLSEQDMDYITVNRSEMRTKPELNLWRVLVQAGDRDGFNNLILHEIIRLIEDVKWFTEIEARLGDQ